MYSRKYAIDVFLILQAGQARLTSTRHRLWPALTASSG